MKESKRAWFVQRPRRIEELTAPHPAKQRQRYEVAKTVELSAIDYENFITDMLVERQFIEDNAARCCRGETWKCLLIRQRGRSDGVLVMPVNGGHVDWAALTEETESAENHSARSTK